MARHRMCSSYSCINVCRVQRKGFEHEADRLHARDPASVNAKKQKYVFAILACLLYSKTLLKH